MFPGKIYVIIMGKMETCSAISLSAENRQLTKLIKHIFIFSYLASVVSSLFKRTMIFFHMETFIREEKKVAYSMKVL